MSEIIGAGGPPVDIIKDVTIETFEADVLDASMTTPVIVDFWADWCGPCKQLAPHLEKAVKAANGAVRLVKIDIDKNQMLAAQMRIQSIPTVYAFFQGRPIDGFQGALPESEIKAFINRVAAAAGAPGDGAPGGVSLDDMLAAAQEAFDAGDIARAADVYAAAAQADETSVAAIAGLARCHLAFGDAERARQTLDLAPADKRGDAAYTAVEAALSLAAGAGGDIAALAAKVEANPEDLQARFELAEAQLAAGAMEPAIAALLAIIELDREWNEEAARKKLLTVFDALGPTNPLTLKARRRLSSILFA